MFILLTGGYAVLYRRGATDFTTSDQWDGRGGADPAPNVEGHTQARDLTARVGIFIEDAPEVHVMLSSLKCAKEAAAPVVGLFGTGVTPGWVWDELASGEWGGLTGDKLCGEKPDELLRLQGNEAFRVPGDESHVDLHTRVCFAFEKFMGFNSTTVVVIHWGPIMSCISLMLEIDLLPVRRPNLAPAFTTSFMAAEQGPQVEFTNDLRTRATPPESIRPTPVAPLGFEARGVNFHSQDPRHFVAVVEEGGFNRAARHLLVSQPVLSQQVTKPERDLYARLLGRGPRHARPILTGEVLLEHVRQMLVGWALCHGRMLRLDSESRSVLFVGQQTGIERGLIRRLISRLGQLYSGWWAELRQISWGDPSMSARSGQTDISFAQLSVVVADDMEHMVVTEEPIVLAVPEGYGLTDRSSPGLAGIVTLPLIALSEQVGDLRGSWLVGHTRREPALVASVAYTPNEVLEAVAAGLRIVLLSLGNLIVHAHPGVVFIPVSDLPPARLAFVRRVDDDHEVTTKILRAARADGALSQ